LISLSRVSTSRAGAPIHFRVDSATFMLRQQLVLFWGVPSFSSEFNRPIRRPIPCRLFHDDSGAFGENRLLIYWRIGETSSSQPCWFLTSCLIHPLCEVCVACAGGHVDRFPAPSDDQLLHLSTCIVASFHLSTHILGLGVLALDQSIGN